MSYVIFPNSLDHIYFVRTTEPGPQLVDIYRSAVDVIVSLVRQCYGEKCFYDGGKDSNIPNDFVAQFW